MIYWEFEAGFDGRFTAPFYLLLVSQQVDPQNLDVWDSPSTWLTVNLGLLVLLLWLFFLSGWLLDRGPTRRCALIVLVVSFPIIFVFGWWLVPRLILGGKPG